MCNLEEVLKERGITQLDLRFLAGTSPSTIYGILHYDHRPRKEVRERIAQALHCQVQDIWPEAE